MTDSALKRYIFASDFDQTLTFNDSGYVLAELVGIPTEEFERKSKGMAKINLVQQGAELAYLLLHDPEFQGKVRKEHLHEVGSGASIALDRVWTLAVEGADVVLEAFERRLDAPAMVPAVIIVW